MEPVKVTWEKNVSARIGGDLKSELAAADFEKIVRKAEGPGHSCYQVSPGVVIEIPAKDWKHGDLLIYLLEHDWLIRRNYVDYWYVDIGITRPLSGNLYCWTDLWLDVVLNREGTKYAVLDADELADAIQKDSVCTELVARGLRGFHRLMSAIRVGAFPTQQILKAERIAQELQGDR